MPDTAPVGFHPALQPTSAVPAPSVPTAVQPAATAVAAAQRMGVTMQDDMCSRSMEQLALLQARAADTGLNSDEHRLHVQLTEFLRVRSLSFSFCTAYVCIPCVAL